MPLYGRITHNIRDKMIPSVERHKFLEVGAQRRDDTRLKEPNPNGVSLSQVENMVDTHGVKGGGRESVYKTVHVLHAEPWGRDIVVGACIACFKTGVCIS